MRQQLANLTCTLRRQASENILQVSIRIMSIQLRKLDQIHDRRRPITLAIQVQLGRTSN